MTYSILVGCRKNTYLKENYYLCAVEQIMGKQEVIVLTSVLMTLPWGEGVCH